VGKKENPLQSIHISTFLYPPRFHFFHKCDDFLIFHGYSFLQYLDKREKDNFTHTQMASFLFNDIHNLYGPRDLKGFHVVPIDPLYVHRLWSFYTHDDACGRCRNVIAGMLMSDVFINAKWEGRQLTKSYKDLLREPMITLLDCMLALGFAPWRWLTIRDSTGQNQAIPYVLTPTIGTFYTYWKDDVLVDMRFGVPADDSMAERLYNVSLLRVYAPDRTGAIYSPLSNVLMRMYLCATVQNSEVQAMGVCARPPLVLEQATDTWLGASAVDEYVDNGGATAARAERDAAAVAAQQLLRNRAGKAADDAAGSTTADAPGSSLYVPDAFTGRWPTAPRGPYYKNKCHLEAGYKLVHQELPRSLTDSEKWRASAERIICNMFGVSVTLLYPDNTSARYKTSTEEAVKITRTLAHANLTWAALMLEGILNAMFQEPDSMRIALEAIDAAKAVGAIPEKIGKSAARAILKTNRYRIKVSFGHSASAEELKLMYYDGLFSLDNYKALMAQHYNMELTVMDGDGLPPNAVPATAAVGAPAPAHPRPDGAPPKKKQKETDPNAS
jgi:hypothetical protein